MNQLPPRPFLRSLVVRTCLLWLVLHVAAVVILALSGAQTGTGLVPSLATSLWVGLGVVVAMHLELVRRGERLVLANLGWSAARLAVLVLTLSSVLEIGLHGLARGLS